MLSLYEVFKTKEGEILFAFDRLYKTYGKGLGKTLKNNGLPTSFAELLSDPKQKKAFLFFYRNSEKLGEDKNLLN